ncbi:hybrid sensor histidine kinase/response regulator [Algisphaera agarilytica]|uniref:histidine kinase n=1 Tax=Algisphaera agarilytica TaxID=1385975 RepID=A0A7X0H852_9BACT|nr:ATP-binding protein [Algisphaera agarilytica]MBB6429580.1 PAS domain S-box-containing protein [Algisphaera agarilytica]
MPEPEANPSKPTESPRAPIGRVVVWGVLYLLALWLGIWLGYAVRLGESELTVVWLSTGVTFGALLLTRRVWWPALLLGSAVVFVAYAGSTDKLDVPLWQYIVFALVGDLVMWLGAEVFWLGRGRAVRLETPGDFGWLFTVVLGVTAVGAFASVSIWRAVQPDLDYWHEVQLWWFSDSLGCVLAVPWMLAFFGAGRKLDWPSPRQWIEGGVLLGLLVLMCLVLVSLPNQAQSVLELPYLVYPLLIWGALRFGVRLTTTMLILLAVLFVLQMKQGVGPFAPNGNGDRLAAYHISTLAVQVYLLVTCLAVLMLVSLSVRDRAAMARQRLQAARFDTMMRTLKPTLWVMEAESNEITYINASIETLAERSVESMLHRPGVWSEIVHPEDREITEASLKVMRERGWDDTEYRIVRPDGVVRWVRELSSAVRDADGKIQQLVGSVEDITHRRQAAVQHQMLVQDLRESNDRYQDFMRISQEGVWRGEFDEPIPIDLPFEEFLKQGIAGGRIAECNEAFAQMYGYDEAQSAAGTRLIDNFRLEDEFNLEYLRRFHASGCQSMMTESRRPGHGPDGETGWFLVSFAGVVEDGKLLRIWGTLTNITELHRLNEQLRESQKMEAVGQLAGGVAHDFNNLLAVISAHAELVQDKVSGVEGVAQSLAVVREAIDHAAGVSRSLLAFSKNLPTEKRPTDIRQVIVQTQRLIDRTLPSTVELAIELPSEGLSPVMGDSVQLQQVLLNLAINARDAMSAGGGTIRIAAEDFERRTTDGESEGKWVRIIVQDDGLGMTEAVRQRIFEPFFSTKGADAGTGLGLSVVRGIIEEHGGSIAVFSRHQKGTTFTLELPCAGQPKPKSNKTPRYARPAAAGPKPPPTLDKPILLGEDDPQIRAVIATALTSRGHRVIQAGDGHALRQAYDAYTRDGEELAALVSDVDMPGRSGLEVLRELRSEGCETPAVVITGSVDLRLDPQIDGNTVLVNKPFGIADFCNVVQKQIDGGAGPA